MASLTEGVTGTHVQDTWLLLGEGEHTWHTTDARVRTHFLLEKTNSGLKLMEEWCYADGWLNCKEKRKKNSDFSTFL